MNKISRILKNLVDASDLLEKAHDVEAWSDYPMCRLYPLEQINTIKKAQENTIKKAQDKFYKALRAAKEITKNFS